MKQFILLIILLEIAVIYTDNLSKNQRPRSIPNFMKKLKQKIGKIKTSHKAAIRVLQNDNETEISDLYDTSETEETGKEDPNIPTVPTTPYVPNSTTNYTQRDESEVYIPLEPYEPEPNPTTHVPVVTTDTKPLKLTGFGNFKPKKTKENNPVLTWYTYFRYYSGKKPKVITYTIFIVIYVRRRLEERSVAKEAQCILVGDKNDFLQYDCNTELQEEEEVVVENIEKITLDPAFTFDGQKATSEELEMNEEAVEEMKNLQEAKEDPYVSLVTNTFHRFYYGNLDTSKPPKFYVRNMQLIQESENTLRRLENDAVTGKYTFRLFDDYTKEAKDYDCSISNNVDGTTYDLECEATVPFNTSINERIGTGAEENNKNSQVLVQLEKDNVLFRQANRAYYKKNSSGLSGGAIAGIVIVCIVALVAISLVIIMLRRRSNKDVPQERSSVVNVNF